MKTILLGLIISVLTLYTAPLYAKQTQCVVNVVDTMGRPIKGAEVSVWEQDFDFDDRLEVITKQLIDPVITDINGHAHIQFITNKPDYGIFIFAQKAGFSVGWNTPYSGARIPDIRIVLDRINATAGIVTDEQNQPIAGAQITAYPVDEALIEGALSRLRWPSNVFTTRTDHEGRFSFDCLAEWMEVSFIAEHPGRAFTDTTYTMNGQQLKLYKAGQKDIHIVMHPAGQIKGQILVKPGNMLKGIKLVACGERIRTGKRFTSVSNTDGSFTFSDLPPDTYLVTTVTGKDDPTQLLTAGAIAEVQLGQAVENIRIRMRDPIQLGVLVKDVKTNQPIRNASIDICQTRTSFAAHVRFMAMTDERGVARISVLPGKCAISASCDGYDGSFGEYLVRSTDTNFMIGLNPHSTVTGQVVYADGRAAEGVEVRVSTRETERKVTDRSGKFSIRFSEQNAQRGFVIARDMKTGMAGIVDITEHEGPVTVVLKPAATVKGRVIDPDGNPVKTARISFTYSIPHYSSPVGNCLYTNENGQYELRAVPYAQENFGYRVSASAPEYSMTYFVKVDIQEDKGDVIELPPLVLKPRNKTLSGVAVYEDGSPAAYKAVHLNEAYDNQGQPQLHSVTDADGKFHFDGACEGWLRIQCGSPSMNDVGFIYAKGGDDAVTVVIDNSHNSQQLNVSDEAPQGKKLPMHEKVTKGIAAEDIENKKLLICFWESHEENSQAVIKELAKIAEQLNSAGVSVILLNGGRGYSGKYAAVNISNDRKWLDENKVPFQPVYLEKTEDLMELRRAVGAKFLSHMVLADENKIVTHEGFDIEWLKDHILAKEDI